MSRKLALLHTVPDLVKVFDGVVRAAAQDLDALHTVDAELFRIGCGTPSVEFDRCVASIARHAENARRGGAGALLVTCSTLGPATDAVSSFASIPIVRIDRPMAMRAVELGRRVGVVATLASNAESSRTIIESVAKGSGSDVTVEDVLVDGAFDRLRNGDNAGHDQLVAHAVQQLAADVDVVVLAQASMARAAAALSIAIPVLSSPGPAVDEAIALVARTDAPDKPPAPGTLSQLVIYRIHDGLMQDWLKIFEHVIVPLNRRAGIAVGDAWSDTDTQEFVWVRRLPSGYAPDTQLYTGVDSELFAEMNGRYVAHSQLRVLADRTYHS